MPEYKFIQPQDYGDWGQEGSDGLIWIGCLACHAQNGAYNFAAYNSQERIAGGLIAETGLMIASLSFNKISQEEFKVASGKFDYFFGRVTSGQKDNVIRSAQNLKDLRMLGIESEEQLINYFKEAKNALLQGFEKQNMELVFYIEVKILVIREGLM